MNPVKRILVNNNFIIKAWAANPSRFWHLLFYTKALVVFLNI